MGGDLRLGILMQMEKAKWYGIVVMRYGENADKVIDAVKPKMKEVEKDCLKGDPRLHDRSELIKKAIELLKEL
jgi:Cu(I)/Ag(I) efflux system membrane protein CusA/SilA